MAPSGMTIDAGTGLITWTPTDAQLGMHDVTVLVDDGRGGIGGQYFNILVQEPNQPPTVAIGSPTTNQQVRVGETLTIQAQAADADGSVSRVEFFLGTALLGEDTNTPFEIDWTPTETDLGQQTLTAMAYDNEDASSESDHITVEVLEALPDMERPAVTLTVTPSVANAGEPVTITVDATDNVAVVSKNLTVDGVDLPLDAAGQATYTSATSDIFLAEATALDADGHAEYRKYYDLRSSDFGLLPAELYEPAHEQSYGRIWDPAF
jgi:hypothetical protein